MDFCFTTISFGDRYYEQSKRFINDRNRVCPNIPLVILTDKPEIFESFHNVYPFNVNEYNEKYSKYESNYYKFDNSCKRFLIPSVIKLGYKNFIYLDNDNYFGDKWEISKVKELFKINHILSPMSYKYMEHGRLGKKVEYYSNYFSFDIPTNEIINLPEGCINFFSFDNNDRMMNFFNTWEECVDIRDKNGLFNNSSLEEIFFSGKKNGMSFGNIKTNTLFFAKHEVWYR